VTFNNVTATFVLNSATPSRGYRASNRHHAERSRSRPPVARRPAQPASR
jgi:hypothetical protein